MKLMVRIVEVGPRDGLQNERTPIQTSAKLAFIERLVDAGLREIEATSFVSPKWVPQLGDAVDLWTQLPHDRATFTALVPNAKGMERAHEVGCRRIALFTAASDAFTQKNINMTVDQSLEVFRELVGQADWVRGYVSTVVECPYGGKVAPAAVARVAQALVDMGVHEISLGDTIGVGTPADVKALAAELAHLPKERVAWHFHDTRGTAIANVQAALDLGYNVFDSSAAGLGGCPYAPGAAGNLATEDLVYLLERQGIRTGVDSAALAQASLPILEALGRSPSAKAQLASLAGAAG